MEVGGAERGHGRIVCVTVTTAALEEQVGVYERWLGYRASSDGRVDLELASAWATPDAVGRPFVLMSPESGTEVFLRFVEGPPAPPPPPLTTLGWAAIEITVQDVDRLHERLGDSPFEILGPPQELEFTDRFRPMQVVGPAGEVLYLNEVRGPLEEVDLPVARSWVDHVFIMVLAAARLDEALAFYCRDLGFDAGSAYELEYGVINRAFGFPADRRHRLAMACVGRRVGIEVDQYPPEANPRDATSGFLPPGIAAVTLQVDDLESVAAPLLTAPRRRAEPPYDGCRTACCRGAAGELVELIEAPG